MAYLRNVWYVAAWDEEVAPGAMLVREILEERLVFFRDEANVIRALADRCPHRFVPLSQGKLRDGVIQCAYHGLCFDATGRCVSNPHGEGKIPGAAAVKAFAVVERHSAIWIWMGDPAAADAGLIPDYGFLEQAPPTARFRGYLPTSANYELIVDNIMDLSHVDYLHATTLGGGAITRTRMSVQELEDGRLHVKWDSPNEIPPPVFGAYLPNPAAKADVWTEVFWSAPGNMLLHTGATPVGLAMECGVDTHNLHLMTPSHPTHTHYFYASVRNFRIDDAEFNSAVSGMVRNIFITEDKWILEAQQERLGDADFLAMKPVLLGIDVGAMRARRLLQQKMQMEQVPK